MSFDAKVDTTIEVVQEETPQVLTVSQLLNDLENGIDRAGIRKKYDLTTAELKMVFAHPKLQGIRVKKHKIIRIKLVDDTDTENPNQMSIPTESSSKEEELRKDAETLQTPKDYDFYTSHNDNQSEIKD